MSNYASKVIQIAQAEVGYLEKASNKDLDSKTGNAGKNNYTKYARDLDAIAGFYNGKKNGYEWCDVFVDWCFVKAYGVDNAKKLLCQPAKSLGAGCTYSKRYYERNGRFKTSPQAGDQIFFKTAKGVIYHTGLVYKVDKTYVYTIEGNTSADAWVVPNGGSVQAKRYLLTSASIAGYGRPAYDKEPASAAPASKAPVSKTNAAVKSWQQAAIKDGFKFPKYGADGEWGSECEAVAKKAIVKKYAFGYKYKNLTKIVQNAVGVTADGLCGSQTSAAIKAYQKKHKLTADGCVGINTWKKILGV